MDDADWTAGASFGVSTAAIVGALDGSVLPGSAAFDAAVVGGGLDPVTIGGTLCVAVPAPEADVPTGDVTGARDEVVAPFVGALFCSAVACWPAIAGLFSSSKRCMFLSWRSRSTTREFASAEAFCAATTFSALAAVPAAPAIVPETDSPFDSFRRSDPGAGADFSLIAVVIRPPLGDRAEADCPSLGASDAARRSRYARQSAA